ncbi:YceD family protein [Devosia albogilva]|uniref:YceD family protein n=1 Tax=Devosia albogilva TaxID=429726 RepID=A0ABW5QNT0_9HYPH
MSPQNEPLFDAVVRIDRLPAGGRSVDVELDAGQREQLAATLKLTSVEHFAAALTVVPLRGGLRARGKLDATIVQPSVVSFEPVTQVIEEEVDRVFLPAERGPTPTPGAEIFVDLEDDDFPDHIDGPEVDLSALLIETLALAIDPYPRLDGESIEDIGLGDQAGESGPFAALSKLKEP